MYPCIVDLPIKLRIVIFHSYVGLPEGIPIEVVEIDFSSLFCLLKDYMELLCSKYDFSH